MTDNPRPDQCCGKCPPILGGGYDCTCAWTPSCPNYVCHLVALDEHVRHRSVCICGWKSNVYPRETLAIKAGMAHIKYPDGTRPNTRHLPNRARREQ